MHGRGLYSFFEQGEIEMNKSAIFLSGIIGLSLIFSQNTYSADEEPIVKKKIEKRYDKGAFPFAKYWKKCCKNKKEKLEKIIKDIETLEEKNLFETDKKKYFFAMSMQAMHLVNVYKCNEFFSAEAKKREKKENSSPSKEHVEALKLHYDMFEAWHYASIEVSNNNNELLEKAHAEAPKLLKNARDLLEKCKDEK